MSILPLYILKVKLVLCFWLVSLEIGYFYRLSCILTSKFIRDTFLKVVEPVNTPGLPLLLVFNLKKCQSYLFLLVCFHKNKHHISRCLKVLIELATPYLTCYRLRKYRDALLFAF